MKWLSVGPWRPIPGSGQSAALTSGADVAFSNPVGANTHAVQISAVGANCVVRISQAGTAATAVLDVLVKATDPPILLGCAPGDHVHAWGLGAGTVYLCEMQH